MLVSVDSKNNSSDLDNNIIDIVKIINDKEIHIATCIFALSIATKKISKIKVYKELLLFMIYTLIFWCMYILPIYLVSNQTKNNLYKYNKLLTRIRTISYHIQ